MHSSGGKIALILDSSRGIGAAIALLAGSEGGVVTVHGQDAGAVEAIVGEIRWEGTDAVAAPVSALAIDDVELVVVCDADPRSPHHHHSVTQHITDRDDMHRASA